MCAFYFFWLSASHDLGLGMDPANVPLMIIIIIIIVGVHTLFLLASFRVAHDRATDNYYPD